MLILLFLYERLDFTTLKKPSSMSSSVFQTVTSLLQETRDEFSKLLKVSDIAELSITISKSI